MAADFHELGERASKRGLQVGFEALARGTHVYEHRDAWAVVRRTEHDNVDRILDSFHTLGRKIDPETIRRILGDKIFFVQLADAPAIDMDLLYWSRHFRNMPGEGDLDVVGFLRAVMATGYAGPISSASKPLRKRNACKMQGMSCRGEPMRQYYRHGSGDPFRPQWRSMCAHRRTKDLALFIQSLRRVAVGTVGTLYGICRRIITLSIHSPDQHAFKRAAQALSKLPGAGSLSACQTALAQASGHRDLHHLQAL